MFNDGMNRISWLMWIKDCVGLTNNTKYEIYIEKVWRLMVQLDIFVVVALYGFTKFNYDAMVSSSES